MAALIALDHLHVETTARESPLTFWARLGLTVGERWGSEGHRAVRRTAGRAAVVPADVDRDPGFMPFFRFGDPEAFDAGGSVGAPLPAAHPRTRNIRVHDPEHRISALEAYA